MLWRRRRLRHATGVAAEIHRLAAKMQLGACANRTRLDETIAVHVRHGDKIGTIHTDAEVQAHAALAILG